MPRPAKSLYQAIAVAMLTLGASMANATIASAQNTTVNFNTLTESVPGSGTRFIMNCYVESGFRFTAVGVGCTGAPAANAFVAGNNNAPGFGFGPGATPALLLNAPTATGIDVARVDGAPFGLVSLGLAPFDMAETDVLLIGTLLGGGTISLSQTLLASQMGLITITAPGTFSGLSSLRIQSVNEFDEPYVIIDNLAANVAVSNVVPEPSTYALMTAGLVAIAVVARRRRATR